MGSKRSVPCGASDLAKVWAGFLNKAERLIHGVPIANSPENSDAWYDNLPEGCISRSPLLGFVKIRSTEMQQAFCPQPEACLPYACGSHVPPANRCELRAACLRRAFNAPPFRAAKALPAPRRWLHLPVVV